MKLIAKNTDNVYHLLTTAHVISLKIKTITSNGLCSYALVYSYYRSSQFRHTSLITLAGERAARVLLTISPDFDAAPVIKN